MHLAPHATCHVVDLPGSGSSTWQDNTDLTIDFHIECVRQVLDLLDLTSIGVIGNDAGGLIARHALAGDPRVRAFGLIDTEQPQGLSWLFRTFVLARHVPGFGQMLTWAVNNRLVRRNLLVLGGAFEDMTLVDGEFEEFFLKPLQSDHRLRKATVDLLRGFDLSLIDRLASVHARITVPVEMVWGANDRFFPVTRAREMVGDFDQANLTVVDDASLFSHEERPEQVAAALLPTLVGRI